MEHPIGNMMRTTMENIKDMVDVNTVIGDPVQGVNDVTIIPVSRVSFGFVAGGGEYGAGEKGNARQTPALETPLPFAGGSGAGVSVQPVGFLVVGKDGVKMLPAQTFTVADRMVELLPQVINDVKSMFSKMNEDDPTPPKEVNKTIKETVVIPPFNSGAPGEALE